MDISALSLALGAQVEQTGQTPVEPGFDLTLEQAEIGGFVPPGAPPGPEPPPDILVAGEGVEELEPNAQPQKLDFLPQTKIDIELPEPFWDKPVDEELPVCPQPVDEAMVWLAGQMTGGFFANPIPSVNDFTPVDPSPVPDCVFRLGSKPSQAGEVPVLDLGKVVGNSPIPSDKRAPIAAVTGCESPISPEILENLNVESVVVDTPETLKPLDIKNAVDVKPIPTTTQVTPEQVSQKPTQEPTVETVAPIEIEAKPEQLPSKPQRTNSEAPATPSVAKTETTSKPVAVAVETPRPGEKPPAEPTTLDTSRVAPQGGKSTSSDSQKEFGQPSKRDDTFAKAVIESTSKVQGQDDKPKHVRPDQAVESAPTLRPSFTTDGKPEALAPKEIDLVIRQVADKLHMLAAARPKNGVTIHLNPEDLGSITVVVKSIGRMVDTQLTASDHRVRQALDQNQTRLVEAMDARGFQVQTVTVSAQTNNSTQHESTRNWQQPSQQQSQSQSGHSQGHRGQGERHFEQPKSNIRAWVRRGEGVDLSI